MPLQVAVVPAHSPWVSQMAGGAPRDGSAVSVNLSQSLSLPSQISMPLGVQAYSQPSLAVMFWSTKPAWQTRMPHTPAVHLGTALAKLHTVQLVPQWVGSFCLSKPSSVVPSQSSSSLLHCSTAGVVPPWQTNW